MNWDEILEVFYVDMYEYILIDYYIEVDFEMFVFVIMVVFGEIEIVL